MSPSLGLLTSFMSSVTWAIASTQYSRLTSRHSAFSVNFTRALVAFPLYVITVAIMMHWGDPQLYSPQSVTSAHITWLGLSIVSSYALGDVLFLWASLSPIGIPGALAIASTYPLWAAVGGWFWRGQTLAVVQIAGLIVVVCGTLLVILSGKKQAGESEARMSLVTGVLFAFGSSLFWALNSYSTARGGEGLGAFLGNSIRMGFALLLCPLASRVFSGQAAKVLPKADFRRNLGLFAFEGYGGSFFYLYGLTHAPLAVASVLSSLAPVLSIPVAWLFGTERLSWMKVLGVCLVVTGLVLLLGLA